MSKNNNIPVEFSTWNRLKDPLPNTSCFIRKNIDTGTSPYLSFVESEEIRCPNCRGTGSIEKKNLIWMQKLKNV